MDDDANKNNLGELQRLTGYIPLASVYAILCGTLYLWGYWSTFEINILQYIDLVDLAKAAAFPLISAVAAVSIGSLLGQATAEHLLPHGGGAETRAGRFLRRHKKTLQKTLLAIYVGLLFLFLIFVETESKWLGFGALVSLVPAFTMASRGALSDIITDPGLRGSVIGILSLLICAGFGFGRSRAADIIAGHEYFLVDQASVGHIPGVRTSKAGELKYLGHTGNFLFLLSPDSSIEILRSDSVPALVIRHKKSHTRETS